MREVTKVEKVLRQAVKDLELEGLTWGEMPTYPNSYKWEPPGKEYTLHILKRGNVTRDRVFYRTDTDISREKRPYGESIKRVWGFPAIKDAGDNAEVVRRYKRELKALGFYS